MSRAPALLLTLLLGLIGGGIFVWLSIPLPWILGSFTATALAARVGLPTHLPRVAREGALAVVGTMLGGGFNEDTLAQITGWLPSMLVMLCLSVLFFLIPYALMRRLTSMDKATAFLSAMPGGLSVMIALAEDYGADVTRIALNQTARVIVLLLIAPVMLHWVSDADIGGIARQQMQNMTLGGPRDLAILGAIALAGFVLSQRVNLPSGAVLLPLILSAAVHASGMVHATVPLPLSVLAQVVIGANIGVRFGAYSLRDLLRDGGMAAGSAVIMGLSAFAGAWAFARVSGQAAAPLLLSYLPGGAPELGVAALALGIDPAMVAAHHMVRVLMITSVTPFLLRKEAIPRDRRRQ